MLKVIRNNAWSFLFLTLLIGLFTIIMVLMFTLLPKKEAVTNVGAVFIANVDDNGWNESHYVGLKTACEKLDRKLIIYENVNETAEAVKPAIDYLVSHNCKVIFLTSDGFGNNIRSIVESYPDVVFYTISPQADAKNMTTYYGRIYQMRYLTGIIAGNITETNVLGFVAAKNATQVDRGINAYLLGARSVNPDAEVKVIFTDTWTDEEREREAARILIEEENADVMTYHSSKPWAIDVAEEHEIYSIGYISVHADHSVRFLFAPVFNWHILYQALLQNYIRGNVNNESFYWWGVLYNVVGLAPYSPLVDADTRDLIAQKYQQFDDGWDVFSGEIYRNNGILMCRSDERISDRALLYKMNWLVEGVTVYELEK